MADFVKTGERVTQTGKHFSNFHKELYLLRGSFFCILFDNQLLVYSYDEIISCFSVFDENIWLHLILNGYFNGGQLLHTNLHIFSYCPPSL